MKQVLKYRNFKLKTEERKTKKTEERKTKKTEE
jgi:hypothetical protein